MTDVTCPVTLAGAEIACPVTLAGVTISLTVILRAGDAEEDTTTYLTDGENTYIVDGGSKIVI